MKSKTGGKFDELKRLAKDLTQEEPRPPHAELAGFPGAARTLDKCRAALVGSEGEYQFGCPADQEFARSININLNDFKDIVASGADDSEVADWLRLNAHPRVAS